MAGYLMTSNANNNLQGYAIRTTLYLSKLVCCFYTFVVVFFVVPALRADTPKLPPPSIREPRKSRNFSAHHVSLEHLHTSHAHPSPAIAPPSTL